MLCFFKDNLFYMGGNLSSPKDSKDENNGTKDENNGTIDQQVKIPASTKSKKKKYPHKKELL